MSIYLPTYVAPKSSTGNAPRSTLNRTAAPRTQRYATAGEGSIIPGGYGRFRVPAKVVTVTKSGNNLLVLCVWMAGPIDAIESVRIDGTLYSSQVNHYLGAAVQTADPWLRSAISGYNDPLHGIAYSVLRLPSNVDIGQRIEAQVRGFRVYDPRTATTAWSPNASLCLAHFIIAHTGRNVDWDSVTEAADANDDEIGGKPRRAIGLLMERPAPIVDWIETLREYAGCYIVWSDPVRLIPDRPRAVDHVIGAEKILDIKLRKRRLDDTPNRVVVEHTKIDGDEWTTGRAATPFPAGKLLREQVVRMIGILDDAQGMRQAIERHNRYQLCDLLADISVPDEGLEIEAGQVIDVTHPIGLENKLFRVVTDPVAPSAGRWQLSCEEYDPAIYSNSTATSPSSPDTNLPDPLDVPAGPLPSLIEDVYPVQPGFYSTRIYATWPESDYVYYHQFRIEVRGTGGELVWSGETRKNEYTTGAIQEGVTYTVSIAVIGLGGHTGAPSSANIVAQGKYLPPGDVPQITAQQVAADAVRAEWERAIDVDIYRYELRRGPPDVAWDDAVMVDLIDGLQCRIEGLPVGSHDLLIRALDSVRNYSPNVTRVTVSVLPPAAPASLSAFEVGGEVRLSWPEGTGYIAAYALRYGDVGGEWDTATRLDRVQALRYTTREIPAGTWRIYVRAVDTAGNLSPGIATADVDVTLDNESFLVGAITWTNPALTNMASWSHRPQNDDPIYYVTDTGQTAAARWPNVMSSYTQPLATYHDNANTEWLSEAHDIGAMVSGNWQLMGGWEALSGSASVAIELSDDGIAWDSHPQTSVQATGRYARVRISATGSGTLLVRGSRVSLRIDAVAREESGEIVTSASAPVTVTLDRTYAKVQTITLTAQGTSALIATYDNVLTGNPSRFDIYTFDTTGDQVSTTVRWLFKGI